MIITGIGSRKISEEQFGMLYTLGSLLARTGATLRSGGAEGSDDAFERAWKDHGGPMEIYLPYDGFMGKRESKGYLVLDGSGTDKIAGKIHPAWSRVGEEHRQFHRRNCYQILGQDLQTPSDLVIACAPPRGNGVSGGTNTAWVLAGSNLIPRFNLWENLQSEDLRKYILFLKSIGKF